MRPPVANKPYTKVEKVLIAAIFILGFWVAFCADPAELVAGL